MDLLNSELLAAFALACALMHTAAAQNTANAKRDYSKQPYIIEKIATDIRFEADGTSTRDVNIVVRVQSDEAVREFGILTIPYDAEYDTLPVLEVTVHKPDGATVRTPDSNAQDMPSEVARLAPMYSGLREKQVPVKALNAGDRLEWRVRQVRSKPAIPDQFWYSQNLTRDAVVLEETLRIDMPANKYVNVRSTDVQPQISREAGRAVYLWKTTHLDPPEAQPAKKQAPVNATPSVQVTTFRNWEDVGLWYRGLSAPRVAVTPAIQAKALEITKGLGSDLEKAQAIYYYVSTKFRYISLSFGAGRYQPHEADEVFSNEYGDCKDKHTLFAALLRAVNIPAWPALIGVENKLDPEVPSPAQFDHLITVLPLGKDLVWLDTTAEVAPWGLLMPLLRGKQALVIPANGAPSLMTTPAAPPFRRLDQFDVKGALNQEGTFKGHFDVTLRGDTELIVRTAFRQTPVSQWPVLAQNLSALYGFGGTLSNLDVENPGDSARPFHYSYDYDRKNYSDWENHRITPPFPPFSFEFGENDDRPAKPIDLGLPGEIVYRATVTLPNGYSAVLPANTKADKDFAAYTASYSVKDGVLTAERRMTFRTPTAALAAWPDYLAFEKSVLADENHWIQVAVEGQLRAAELVRQGMQAMQANEVIGAREAFRQAEQLDAKSPGLQFALANLCLMDNRYDEAMEHYRKEIANNPGNTAMYRLVAAVQTSHGRVDDAIGTWRDLVKRAPEDLDAVGKLSGLLLQRKRYDEALAPVKTALAGHAGNVALEAREAEILLRSGKAADGVAVCHTIAAEHPDDSMTLNDIAYAMADTGAALPAAKDYAEKAVSGIERASSGASLASLTDDDLKRTAAIGAAWDTLGWAFCQLGDFAAAESYLKASWMLGEGADPAIHLGHLYERQGKTESAIHAYRLALAAYPRATEARERLLALGQQPEANTFTSSAPQSPGRKTARSLNPNTAPIHIDAAEEIGQLRTAAAPGLTQTEGSAEFWLLFSARKTENAQFIQGAENLKSAAPFLLKAHYEVPFPDQGPEKLVRRGILSCSKYETPSCHVVLLLPGQTKR